MGGGVISGPPWNAKRWLTMTKMMTNEHREKVPDTFCVETVQISGLSCSYVVNRATYRNTTPPVQMSWHQLWW